jgi:hypothetical protein
MEIKRDKKKMFHSWVILGLVFSLIISVSKIAEAGSPKLISPKTTSITISFEIDNREVVNEQIIKKNPITPYDKTRALFDVKVEYDCGLGKEVNKLELEEGGDVYFPNQPLQKVSHVFRGVDLGKQDASGMVVFDCNKRNQVVMKQAGVHIEAWCRDKSTKSLIKYPSQLLGIPMTVTCEKQSSVNAKTIPIKYRHTCPKGYQVKGTIKRAVENANKGPVKCISKRRSTGTRRACPFIFTQKTPDGEWIEQGTILTYHNGKETERTQVTELTAFSGKILIKEIDPETSYTDSLKVILYYEDGSKEVLLPINAELKETDGNYLITNQGDEVVVDFGSPSRSDFERAELIADGYYELY